MDIFEEIKEAVMQATPGEDTRNYYRDQGMAIERERIIKLLEEVIGERQQVEQTTWVQNEISNLNYLIELIKGETK